MADVLENFVKQLTDIQQSLYVYILSLLGNPTDADEVLQETNLLLWRKSGEFEPGTNFVGWAAKVAYYQVLTFRKKRGREILHFETSVVESMATIAEKNLDRIDSQRIALEACLDKLRPFDKDLIQRRYRLDQSPSQIAEILGRSLSAVYQSLYRVRISLMSCVRNKVASE